MNKLHRTTRINYLQPFKNNSWLLNVYLIQSNASEKILESDARELIEKYLNALDENCISKEFEYFRTGFAFLHYGNRGIDLTIWHYGRWGNTYEVYSCSWYCYGRDVDKMELLDSAEPIICQYEILYLTNEISAYSKVLESKTDDIDFRTAYKNYYLNTL